MALDQATALIRRGGAARWWRTLPTPERWGRNPRVISDCSNRVGARIIRAHGRREESVVQTGRHYEDLSHPGAAAAIDRLLAAARRRFRRLSPAGSLEAARAGGLIVDIRSELQREQQGLVPGALFIPRNVLEWRADPTSPHHDPVLAAVKGPLVLMCAEGYQSSLAAAALVELGVANAADMEGGYDRWRGEGLPTVGAPCRSVERESRSPRPTITASTTGGLA